MALKAPVAGRGNTLPKAFERFGPVFYVPNPHSLRISQAAFANANAVKMDER
jgi:hypothetical protein